MEFRKVLSWLSDNKPETTESEVYVSKCGVVKCGEYKHWNKKNNGYSVRKEKVYKQSFNRGKQRLEGKARKETHGKGYASVSIRNKTYLVHRLVALAWLPNPEGKPQVNHIDGVRDNNHADNLEWVTNLENRKHAKENLKREHPKGSKVKTAKLSETKVLEIKRLLSEGKLYQKDIAAIFGVAQSTITWIKKGGGWSHV